MLTLLFVGIVDYFPRYVAVALNRARYYLFGTDSGGRDVVLNNPHDLEL